MNITVNPQLLIYSKMAEASAKIGSIQKNAENRQQNFKFRRIDDIYNGVHDALSECGIFCIPKILKTIREKEISTKSGTTGYHMILEIEYTFYTIDGSSVSAIVWGEGTDYGDKCINKCMSIAHKYALIQVFTIPTEDMTDPDESPCQTTSQTVRQMPLKALNQPQNLSKNHSVDAIISHFAKLGVDEKHLELFLKKPLDSINENDKANLRILAEKVKNGEFIE